MARGNDGRNVKSATLLMSLRLFVSVRPRRNARGDMTGSKKAGLFGAPKQVAVERGLAEFRAGRPVIIASTHESTAVLPVDVMTYAGLAAYSQLCSPGLPYPLVTSPRTRLLHLHGP